MSVSKLVRGLVLLLVATAPVAVSLPAQAQDGASVVYSYEKIQVGNTTQWALIPKTSDPLSGDAETDLRAAFKALRNAKPPTYGNSELIIEPKELAKGHATVKIDAEKAAYALIIEAEVLQTFETRGVSKVSFTGAVDKSMSVLDSPFAAFMLIVPLYRALPPAELPDVHVHLPDDTAINARVFAEKLAAQDATAVKWVFDELERSDTLSRVGILERLPALKLPDWDKAAAKRLADSEKTVRIAAVNALRDSKDSSVLDTFVKLVDSDPETDVRAAAASALAVNSDAKYSSYGLYYVIRGSDPKAALVALDELVKRKPVGAGPEIVKALANPDAAVGKRAATALRELELSDELKRALRDEKLAAEVRLQAAVELGTLKDKDLAFAGNSYVAAQGPAELASQAIEALRVSKDPEPFDAIATALQNPDVAVRIVAAKALAKLQETDSLKPMADAARATPEASLAIEDAMVDLLVAAEKVSDLEDRLAKDKDELIRRCDYRALARKAQQANRFAQVRDKLVAGLDDAKELARGGALLALAVEPNEENLGLIAVKASDASASVRADVALALRAYPAGQATDVLLLLAADAEPSVAIAALATLGARQEKAVLKDVVKMGKHEKPEVRAALLRAAGAMYADDTQSDVVAFVSNALFDAEASVKLVAVDVLGGLNNSQAVGSVALFLQDPDPVFQHAAIVALGNSHHPDAIPLLVQALSAPERETRIVAVDALAVHGSVKSLPELQALLTRETDPDVVNHAEAAVKKLQSDD